MRWEQTREYPDGLTRAISYGYLRDDQTGSALTPPSKFPSRSYETCSAIGILREGYLAAVGDIMYFDLSEIAVATWTSCSSRDF